MRKSNTIFFLYSTKSDQEAIPTPGAAVVAAAIPAATEVGLLPAAPSTAMMRRRRRLLGRKSENNFRDNTTCSLSPGEYGTLRHWSNV